MSEFYSYLWLREDGTPYYAGKGSGKRAYQSQGHIVGRPKDRSRILVFPMLTEAEAYESEAALIELFGRKDLGTGCLRNMSSGGDTGFTRPPWGLDRRLAQAERMRQQGLGGWNKGMKMPSVSEKMKGRPGPTKGKHPHTPEGNRRISESKKGIPLSPEHCAKLSAAHKGKPWSPAQRAARDKSDLERFIKKVAWG